MKIFEHRLKTLLFNFGFANIRIENELRKFRSPPYKPFHIELEASGMTFAFKKIKSFCEKAKRLCQNQVCRGVCVISLARPLYLFRKTIIQQRVQVVKMEY